jgi:leader peptidase (prepilin peptidase)/N-methyltransferase
LNQLHPLVVEAMPLVMGLIVGSFANVCIHRIPRGVSVVSPPSRCPGCGNLVRATDNVPVLGWLLLRGRCRACRAPISPRYPLVEAANGLLYQGLWLLHGPSVWTFVAMPLATALLVLALIDLEHQILPDVITRPGIALGIAAAFLPGWPLSLWAAAGSAAGGYLVLALVAWVYERARGHEGLGQGDWKMAGMLGAFLGWQKLLLVVFLASLAGMLVGLLAMALRGGDMKTKLPLGTFLGAAGIAALFVGDRLVAWYAAFYRG